MRAMQRALPVVIGATVVILLLGGVGAPVLWADQDACNCPHPGDPNGDGFSDIADAVRIIQSAFAGGPITWDPDCPRAREDYNADGIVDVRDLTGILDYVILGVGPSPLNPCDCLIDPPLCQPVVDPNPGGSGNTVVVESKMVFAGQTGVPIGIKLTNPVPLRFIVVPLVARSIDPGAFITSVKMEVSDRLADVALSDVRATEQYADPDGVCGLQGFRTITFFNNSIPAPLRPVSSSPEGFLFVRGSMDDVEHELSAGADATGSLELTVDVTTTLGSFEIDTTCTDPANHLEFIQDNPPTSTPIVPAFTKGIITIVANMPPVAQCQNMSVPAGANCAADASVDNGSYDPDGGSVTVVQIPPGPYLPGITPVTLIVTDMMGAKDTCQASVTVIDDTPPVITCPDSIITRIGAADSGAVISYVCTATDNCPGLSVVCTPPSGAFFSRGVTLVTCIATDAAGLADTCHFTVTAFSDCFDRMSDVNCDGVIDVQDVVMMIEVAFRNGQQTPCPVPK